MRVAGRILPPRIAAAFRVQAEACDGLGSPFTASVCRALMRGLDGTTAFGSRIAGWEGDPVADALPLRACGALHFAARTGRARRPRGVRITKPSCNKYGSTTSSSVSRSWPMVAAIASMPAGPPS